MRLSALFAAVALCLSAQDQPIRTYVADLGDTSVTVAWGRADGVGRNSIGKAAAGSGNAVLSIDGRSLPATGSSLRVDGLRPDTNYPYTLQVNGAVVASATVRTWPGTSDSLTFFVIGDFGTGDKVQMDLAARMEAERKARENSASPVRFVISTGDNIYGQFSGSGADDRDWDKKFFIPYEPILRTIPFKAVLGNHDGNESERTGDLATCLDNFFMPARWYQFSYGAFAEFIALDTTRNQPTGPKAPLYLPGGEQSKWLTEALARPPAPWRFVIMHHPMFTAGPRHKPFLLKVPHWMQAIRDGHVQAVFSGHEHNLQFSEQAEATGNMLFVVSGAGGELRPESVTKRMRSRHIAAWGNQNHFLIVTITGNQLSVEPIGVQPVFLRDSSEKPAPSTVRSRSK